MFGGNQGFGGAAGGMPGPEGPSERLVFVREVVRRGLVTPALQPVVDLADGAVVGYEALARGPAGSPLHGAPSLFSAAAEAGLSWELEVLCRRRALEAKREHLGEGRLIFVNIDLQGCPVVNAAAAGFHFEWLDELGIDRSEVVLEMSERLEVSGTCMRRKVADFHRGGFRIALDDVGTGRWDLDSLPAATASLAPHFLKADRSLVQGIERDPERQAGVAELAGFCRERGIRLVAEGVDSAEALVTLRRLGVPYGQGYFLGMPQARPAGLSPEASNVIRSLSDSIRHAAGCDDLPSA